MRPELERREPVGELGELRLVGRASRSHRRSSSTTRSAFATIQRRAASSTSARPSNPTASQTAVPRAPARSWPDGVGAEVGNGRDRLAGRRVLDRDPGLGGSLGHRTRTSRDELIPNGPGGPLRAAAAAPPHHVWSNAHADPLGPPPRIERRHRPASPPGAPRDPVGRARGRGRGRPAGRRGRASRPPAVGGPRAGATVLRRARVRDRRRPGRGGAGKPRPPPARGVARAPPARGSRAARAGAAGPGRVRPAGPARRGDRANADRARLPGGVAAGRGLRDPRPFPRPPPHRADLRAPRGRRRRAGAGRLRGGSRAPGSPGDPPRRASTTTSASRRRSTRSCSRSRRRDRDGSGAPTPRPGSGRRWAADTDAPPGFAAGCLARWPCPAPSASPTGLALDPSDRTSHRARSPVAGWWRSAR